MQLSVTFAYIYRIEQIFHTIILSMASEYRNYIPHAIGSMGGSRQAGMYIYNML